MKSNVLSIGARMPMGNGHRLWRGIALTGVLPVALGVLPHPALCAGLTAAILAVLLPEQAAAQLILRTDQSLRSTMSTRLRAEGATHQLVPDLATLGMSSTRARFLVGAVVVPEDGLVGILEGEPFALVAVEGPQLKIPKGTYRIQLEGDSEALLLRSNGSVVGRGTTAINWIANPGTPYCEWDPPPPGVNETCLTCQYGNPNGPGGVWSVSTCFAY